MVSHMALSGCALLVLATVAAAQMERYINCGGSTMQEKSNDWVSDVMADGTVSYVESTTPTLAYTSLGPINATMWKPIYFTHRWSAGDLTYSIPVRGAKHSVKLLFAETYFGKANKRAFTVKVNGQMWMDERTGATNLDVFKKVGGKNRALMVDFNSVDTTVEGAVVITLGKVPGLNHPMISGIVIDYQTKSRQQLGSTAAVAVAM